MLLCCVVVKGRRWWLFEIEEKGSGTRWWTKLCRNAMLETIHSPISSCFLRDSPWCRCSMDAWQAILLARSTWTGAERYGPPGGLRPLPARRLQSRGCYAWLHVTASDACATGENCSSPLSVLVAAWIHVGTARGKFDRRGAALQPQCFPSLWQLAGKSRWHSRAVAPP